MCHFLIVSFLTEKQHLTFRIIMSDCYVNYLLLWFPHPKPERHKNEQGHDRELWCLEQIFGMA